MKWGNVEGGGQVQGVGQIFADALADYFFAPGSEAAGSFGSGHLEGAPTPHCRNILYSLHLA